MKKVKIWALFFLCMTLFISGCQSTKKSPLDSKNPTTITIWHYYNGAQQAAFNELVEEFNNTKGKEEGIIVESSSQGTVSDLEKNVLDAVNKKARASEVPNIFAAYADTASEVDKLGQVEDLSKYFTEAELETYMDAYIEEGRFSDSKSLKLFPIAKSLEVLVVNETDWNTFASATGHTLEELQTIEGVVTVAKAYYEWSDGLTDTPNDGKALFGRDAMANYFIIGAKQLGMELLSYQDGKTSLNFDKEVVKKLWDHYYVPFISGYFSASGRFRSDDMKTGNVISFVGSSSGATFLPKEVILGDQDRHEIALKVLPAPQFAGSNGWAVQQGAGMVVTKSDEKEVYASVEFLKWFTSTKRNIQFSIESGYLPVTKEANSTKRILENNTEINPIMQETIKASMETIDNNTLFTTKVFTNATDVRSVLDTAMSNKAKEDRKVVISNIENGMHHKQAVDSVNSDENFETWYQETKITLETFFE